MAVTALVDPRVRVESEVHAVEDPWDHPSGLLLVLPVPGSLGVGPALLPARDEEVT